ncbi:type II toxin-antitoxin system HicA family toxin [Billgrantia endophytica]|uniref:Addiction module toxin, HicA family n=1 Tax=Billgrantia endophytica TaxID=2033802 RepID=A0A2N7U9I2_9GAMM|nr:type II toxin-antitoxin system HicA family toxin [Halomonas endophytica]PMR77096.1 hypothetical protein C1H69_03540 [Halomonas endophytica]
MHISHKSCYNPINRQKGAGGGKPVTITVPHPKKDVKIGVEKAIRKQAGLA